MFDTHSHLFDDEFNNDRDLCIKRAKDNKVMKCMLVGYSHEANLKAYNLTKQDPKFFYNSARIHPSEISLNLKNDIKILEEFIKEHKVYAIGEIGLDYHYGKDDKENQKEYFIAQMKLAAKYKLPVIIHSRDAIEDTYNILKMFPDVKGIMHCYSSSWEMAKEFIKLGYYIALGGVVTFKNAKNAKEVAKNIAIDKLLIETDCPYLAPTPYRGKRNETAYIYYTCEEIAKIRNEDFSFIDEQTSKNARKIFNLED